MKDPKKTLVSDNVVEAKFDNGVVRSVKRRVKPTYLKEYKDYVLVLLRMYRKKLGLECGKDKVGWPTIRNMIMSEEDYDNGGQKSTELSHSDLNNWDRGQCTPRDDKFFYIDRFVRALIAQGKLDAIRNAAELELRHTFKCLLNHYFSQRGGDKEVKDNFKRKLSDSYLVYKYPHQRSLGQEKDEFYPQDGFSMNGRLIMCFGQFVEDVVDATLIELPQQISSYLGVSDERHFEQLLQGATRTVCYMALVDTTERSRSSNEHSSNLYLHTIGINESNPHDRRESLLAARLTISNIHKVEIGAELAPFLFEWPKKLRVGFSGKFVESEDEHEAVLERLRNKFETGYAKW